MEDNFNACIIYYCAININQRRKKINLSGHKPLERYTMSVTHKINSTTEYILFNDMWTETVQLVKNASENCIIFAKILFYYAFHIENTVQER